MPLKPLRDGNGHVVPHDHEEISDAHGVIRRISMEHIVNDEKCPTGRRLSTMLFRASSGPNGGMSVDLQHEIEKAGLEPKTYITTPQFFGAVRLTAGQFRSEGFQVGADPLPTNPYHGEVWGSFTRGKQNRLLALSEWFVPIDGVSIS